jgi:hypothetical protein
MIDKWTDNSPFITLLWVSPLLDDVGTYLIPPEKIRKHFLKEVPRGKGKHLKLIKKIVW